MYECSRNKATGQHGEQLIDLVKPVLSQSRQDL